tara:strand:+ start:37 stop:519 length:483 start_codon:yes stop_codon:yes gene_type:complete
MINIALIFIFGLHAICFQLSFNRNYNTFLRLANKGSGSNEEENKEIKNVRNININFEEVIKKMDEDKIKELEHIPNAPEKEEDIKEDSFEGYLKTLFFMMKSENNKTNFDRFCKWRKQIGTTLTEDELSEIYYSVCENECDLMEFIQINKIIDENDGAKF